MTRSKTLGGTIHLPEPRLLTEERKANRILPLRKKEMQTTPSPREGEGSGYSLATPSGSFDGDGELPSACAKDAGSSKSWARVPMQVAGRSKWSDGEGLAARSRLH